MNQRKKKRERIPFTNKVNKNGPTSEREANDDIYKDVRTLDVIHTQTQPLATKLACNPRPDETFTELPANSSFWELESFWIILFLSSLHLSLSISLPPLESSPDFLPFAWITGHGSAF